MITVHHLLFTLLFTTLFISSPSSSSSCSTKKKKRQPVAIPQGLQIFQVGPNYFQNLQNKPPNFYKFQFDPQTYHISRIQPFKASLAFLPNFGVQIYSHLQFEGENSGGMPQANHQSFLPMIVLFADHRSLSIVDIERVLASSFVKLRVLASSSVVNPIFSSRGSVEDIDCSKMGSSCTSVIMWALARFATIPSLMG